MSTLACDVGGTTIKLGFVQDGELVATRSIPAHSQGPLADALPRIREALGELCDEAGVEFAGCRGIGMGFPALVNHDAGRVIDHYGKFTDAPDVDLNGWARDVLGLPLAAENDARLALIGEWRHGAGQSCDNLAIVTLGTGIGTAVITEGHVLRGPNYQAGNLCSHLTINPNGRRCSCGNIGCVEAESGSQYLGAIAGETPGFSESTLAGVSRLDYQQIFEHAKVGDRVAQRMRDHAVGCWAVLCVNLIHAFDVQRIILGGGIMASAEDILPAVRRHVEQHAHTPHHEVDIAEADRPEHMALLGCEWLVQEKLNQA